MSARRFEVVGPFAGGWAVVRLTTPGLTHARTVVVGLTYEQARGVAEVSNARAELADLIERRTEYRTEG